MNDIVSRLRQALPVLLAATSIAICSSGARSARADTMVAIMSEASAPEFAAAARLSATSGHRLLFRSTPQVARMDDAALRALLEAADVLVLSAVFGEDAVRLRPHLSALRARTILPLHGDAQFMRHARADGQPAFSNVGADAAARQLRELAAKSGSRARDQSPEGVLAQARRYRDGGGVENLHNLFQYLLAPPPSRAGLPAPQQRAAIRYLDTNGKALPAPTANAGPAVAILDYDSGDQVGSRDVHQALCRALSARDLGCVSVLARWGQASIDALHELQDAQRRGGLSLHGLVVLQDFVVGGGVDSKRAGAALTALDVPIIKAVRLSDRSASAWMISEDGLPDDSVNYRLAMPELQAIGQPFVVAAAGDARIEPSCGLEIAPPVPIAAEVDALAARLARLSALRTKANADKRLAIIYYNHPPGRHNIGADNLDVPASLLSILQTLQKAGYHTGELPADSEALLKLLQERGVNLPEDRAALAAMAPQVANMSGAAYDRYYSSLAPHVQASLQAGPLSALFAAVDNAQKTVSQQREAEATTLARNRVMRTLGDVRHLLEGATHPERDNALSALDALETHYKTWLTGDERARDDVERTTNAISRFGIEGLAGWGPPPGEIMTYDGDLVLPGLTFGNIFVGPQPPRGWELNEELLHANLAFPPPHQYLALYGYLREQHHADAIVHVGRHSTYEFLPGRRAGVGEDDFSRMVLQDVPSVYIYIVDGVGEGIQAKRRGQAIIVDHLTPSLSTSPLYDDLLSLRQLVESYEASANIEGHTQSRALAAIRATIARLHMRKELEASMRPELQARGISFDEVDGELLVHEVGHYLTKLQERFMPHGLHIFGRTWSAEAVDRMLTSMAADGPPNPASRRALRESPSRENAALLAGLSGRFVAPGPGNDPIRTPEVLPTGRSFHALDASVLPTALGFELGAELAAKARKDNPGKQEGAEAVVLWASDTVRDEGAMIGFGMDMLGVTPRWNSRGIVRGLQRLPLTKGRVRRDASFIASGLFRDLYASLCQLLDQAVRVALAGAERTIGREHPQLRAALTATLAPLGDDRDPGDETLAQNHVAAHWAKTTTALLQDGVDPAEAGMQAAARVFGDAPGTYGAGVNRLVERSGSWQSPQELVGTYVRRLGHAYGGGRDGAPAHEALRRMLARTEHTYLGRASNLYGVLDNNDVFDYLGGLNLAVEEARGAPPVAHVVQHSNPTASTVEPLPSALLSELRGRHLNPTYLKGLMAHGYAGARTMGSGFVENLWGWQVTSPHIVRSWVWDEVKAVYLEDKHGIGLRDFLERGENVHVKTNMQAILLVAAHKGYWEADEATLQALSTAFAQAVVDHGLPGSGHTRPDHPMFADVIKRIPAALASALQARRDAAQGASAKAVLSELRPTATPAQEQQTTASDGGEAADDPHASSSPAPWPVRPLAIMLAALTLTGLGFLLERRKR